MGSRPRREVDEGAMQHSDLLTAARDWSEPSDLSNIVPFLEDNIAQDIWSPSQVVTYWSTMEYRINMNKRRRLNLHHLSSDCNFKLDTKLAVRYLLCGKY